MNDGFLFYGSFYDALRRLPTPELRDQAYTAICRYALYGEEPGELEPMVEVIFVLARPQIDANTRRRVNGGKGGRKPMVSESENQWLAEAETDGSANGKPKEKVKEKVKVKETTSNEVVKKSAPRFTPPTREQVAEYILSAGYSVDADRFVDFYESKGWMVGKNPMKDWKAAVRNWSRSQRQEETAKAQRQEKTAEATKFSNFPQRDYDCWDAMERELLSHV